MSKISWVQKWLEDKANLELFLNGAMGTLKTLKHIATTADRTSIVYRKALQEWGYPEIMDQFDNAADALTSFTLFCKGWKGYTPTLSKVNLAHLRVNFSVPFGKRGAMVEFSADAFASQKDVENWSIQDIEEAYRELWDFCAAGYLGFAKNPPSLTGAIGNSDPPAQNGRSSTGIALEDCILCEMTHIFKEQKTDENGEIKTYYRLFGGRFSKHGVMVWPEVLTDGGVNLDKVSPGKKALRKGGKMWVQVEKKDGKEIARKVVQIERGQ